MQCMCGGIASKDSLILDPQLIGFGDYTTALLFTLKVDYMTIRYLTALATSKNSQK